MEFVFRGKYALRIDQLEVDYLNTKLNNILAVNVTPKGEVTADHICGERDIDEEWREGMFLDSWILTIYPTTGQTMLFVKCLGENNVTVRAINTETHKYETFEMDVVETIDVLRDLSEFIRQSNSQPNPVENGFGGC